eukprot:57536-Amphidinium_carterae.1
MFLNTDGSAPKTSSNPPHTTAHKVTGFTPQIFPQRSLRAMSFVHLLPYSRPTPLTGQQGHIRFAMAADLLPPQLAVMAPLRLAQAAREQHLNSSRLSPHAHAEHAFKAALHKTSC